MAYEMSIPAVTPNRMTALGCTLRINPAVRTAKSAICAAVMCMMLGSFQISHVSVKIEYLCARAVTHALQPAKAWVLLGRSEAEDGLPPSGPYAELP